MISFFVLNFAFHIFSSISISQTFITTSFSSSTCSLACSKIFKISLSWFSSLSWFNIHLLMSFLKSISEKKFIWSLSWLKDDIAVIIELTLFFIMRTSKCKIAQSEWTLTIEQRCWNWIIEFNWWIEIWNVKETELQ